MDWLQCPNDATPVIYNPPATSKRGTTLRFDPDTSSIATFDPRKSPNEINIEETPANNDDSDNEAVNPDHSDMELMTDGKNDGDHEVWDVNMENDDTQDDRRNATLVSPSNDKQRTTRSNSGVLRKPSNSVIPSLASGSGRRT